MSRIIDQIPTLSPEQRRQLRANCETVLRNQPGTPKAAEAEKIIAALDEHETMSAHAERAATDAMHPVDRIVYAFTRQPLTEAEVKLIRVLLDHPGATSGDLTQAMGWQGGTAWHMHFGTLCKDREALLWPAHPTKRKDELGNPEGFYSGILATLDPATHGFTLRPEAVEAFARLGIRARR